MESSSLGRIEQALPQLLDSTVGIINQLYEVPREPGAPNFFHFAGRAANTLAFSNQENFCNTGGASSDAAVAIAKAAGEAVERYCAALYEATALPLASYSEAPFPCVDPADFALYDEAQYESPGFPWAPFDADSPIRWTPAIEVLTGAVRYVPAAFTWIPYHFDQAAGETPIGQPISTGLACHESWERSALSGACEVVERDAFTLMWQGRRAPPQLRPETLSDRNYDLVRRFERTGDRVRLLDITTDTGVTCILSILSSEARGRPAFVFAASANPDPDDAVRKALEELAHTRRYSEQVLRWMPCPSSDEDYAEVTTQAQHLRLAADSSSAEAFRFLFDSSERVDFDDLDDRSTGTAAGDLKIVCEGIAQTGLRTYVADLTSPDIRRLGLSVTRTMVPGLHPLFMGHGLRARGGARLRERLEAAGLTQDNSYPHPYP